MSIYNHPSDCEDADKLKVLCLELRRIMTQLSDSAILEQLQEAIDTAES